MTPSQRVGFIGIGNMGYPMAGHLVRAGFAVTVHDSRDEMVERFRAEHPAAGTAPSLEELGRGSDTVITMLPTSDIVRTVILGNGDGGDAVARGLGPGSTVIDMSTSDPTATQRLAAELAPRGVRVIDAPVAGGVVFARNGTLAVTAGGDAADIERCRPLLAAMSDTVIHCGPIGAGHAMKALQNYVNAAALVATLEAMAAGSRYGIPVPTMVEALTNATTGRNAPLLKKVVPHVLTRRFATGMAIGLIAKDVKIAADAAEAVGARADFARRCFELWKEASDRYGFTRDQSEVARLWEDAAGVELTAPPA